MNKHFSLFTIFALTLTLLCSCDEKVTPNGGDTKENQITYATYTDYTPVLGMIQNYGPDEESNVYDIDIILVAGMTMEEMMSFAMAEDGVVPKDFLNIYLDFGASTEDIIPGTYPINNDGNRTAERICYASIAFTPQGSSLENEDGIIEDEISQGNVIVTKEGTTYTFEIDGTTATGKKVTAYYYKGALINGDIMG